MSVLLLSGGLDSTILLADLCSRWIRPLCLTVYYGQRHAREIDSAEAVADFFRCPHKIVDLSGVFPSCPLTGDGDVPAGIAFDAPEQAATVVPGRNAVLLAIAASHAASHEEKEVFIACHASDEAVYPDCRPAFISSMNAAMKQAGGVRVEAPYLEMTRRQVVALGRELSAPFQMTWSCYMGGGSPCGACGACIERREAGA